MSGVLALIIIHEVIFVYIVEIHDIIKEMI